MVDEITISLAFGIIGTGTGIFSLFMYFYFSNKTLKQTDKNFKTQLLYQDKKNALQKLQNIANTLDVGNFENNSQNLKEFLRSESIFIPKNIVDGVLNHLHELEDYDNKNNPDPWKEYENQLVEEYVNQFADHLESLDKQGKFDYDFKNKT